MKSLIGAVLLFTLTAAAAGADGVVIKGTFVHWASIVGIIQPGNVVSASSSAGAKPGVTGAGEPWTAQSGQASVDLTNSSVRFEVQGLVLAGGNAIGTPGPVTQIAGTLVCNPGASTQAVISTPAVSLNARGDASFEGSFSSSTDACSPTSLAFLITTLPSSSTAGTGNWIAFGAVPATIAVSSRGGGNGGGNGNGDN